MLFANDGENKCLKLLHSFNSSNISNFDIKIQSQYKYKLLNYFRDKILNYDIILKMILLFRFDFGFCFVHCKSESMHSQTIFQKQRHKIFAITLRNRAFISFISNESFFNPKLNSDF